MRAVLFACLSVSTEPPKKRINQLFVIVECVQCADRLVFLRASLLWHRSAVCHLRLVISGSVVRSAYVFFPGPRRPCAIVKLCESVEHLLMVLLHLCDRNLRAVIGMAWPADCK